MEDVFSYSDGETSLLDIAVMFNYEWDKVKKAADGLVRAGLFTAGRKDGEG